jgi:hypothetical protein
MFQLLLPLLAIAGALMSVLLTLPTINYALNKFGITFSEGRFQLRWCACAGTMVAGGIGSLAYVAELIGATDFLPHAARMSICYCLLIPILILAGRTLHSAVKKRKKSFVPPTSEREDQELDALAQMIDTNIPDGREIANRMNKHLSAKQALATVNIATALVQRYITESAASTTASICIQLARHELQLSELDEKYLGDGHVRQAIVRLLREKSWFASFRGPNATIAPLPDSPADNS